MEPIEAGTRNYYPTTLILAARGYHPEYQSVFYLLISGLFFGASAYCNAHTGDGDAMFVLKIYGVFAVLIVSRKPLLRARINMADFIRRFCFGFIWMKGAVTLFFFAFFNWLGNKLLTQKDIFIVLTTVFFFLHLVLLQDIYLITDDLGISQGVLLAGFGVVLADSTSYNLPHVIGYVVAFSFFLAVLNTKKPPAIPPPVETPPPETVVDILPETSIHQTDTTASITSETSIHQTDTTASIASETSIHQTDPTAIPQTDTAAIHQTDTTIPQTDTTIPQTETTASITSETSTETTATPITSETSTTRKRRESNRAQSSQSSATAQKRPAWK